MQKILIPTDFSENAARAIAYASALFADRRCLFILVHIQKPTENEVDYASKVENVSQQIEKCKKVFTNPNHHVDSLLSTGRFIESIRKIVEAQEIDLIVMGTKGTNNSTKMPIGTNTRNIITKVQCPVLVVPNKSKYGPIKEVVFPTDLYLRYSSKTMEPLTSILVDNKSILNIIYRKTNKAELTKTQLISKEYLNNIHNEITVKFHEITSANLRGELKKYIDKNDTQLIAMSAKSLNFIQVLISKGSPETDSFIRNTPFLFLHESI